MTKSILAYHGQKWKLCARPKKDKNGKVLYYSYFLENIITRKRKSVNRIAGRKLLTSEDFTKIDGYYKNGSPKYQKLPKEEIPIRDQIIKKWKEYDMKDSKGEEQKDFITFWEEAEERKNHRTYSAARSHFVNYFGQSISFSDLSPEKITGWVSSMEGKLHSNTVSQYFRRASIIWNEAIFAGYTDKNPFKKALRKNRKKLKIRKSETYYLAPDQIARLASCEGSIEKTVRAAFLFSCYTGLRYSDAVRLTWENVDLTTRKLRFRQKKSNSEVIYLPLSSKAIKYLKWVENDGGKIFKGLPSDSSYVNYKLQAWAREAGLNLNFNLTYHISRHSFGTNYLRVCGDIYKVKKAMGHSSIEQTMRYAKVNVEDMAEELDRM